MTIIAAIITAIIVAIIAAMIIAMIATMIIAIIAAIITSMRSPWDCYNYYYNCSNVTLISSKTIKLS